jgi:hypothetical protein
MQVGNKDFNKEMVLTNVLLVSGVVRNVCSTTAATLVGRNQGLRIKLFASCARVLRDNKLVVTATSETGRMSLWGEHVGAATEGTEASFAAEESAMVWRKRLGHLSPSAMRRLVKKKMAERMSLTCPECCNSGDT